MYVLVQMLRFFINEYQTVWDFMITIDLIYGRVYIHRCWDVGGDHASDWFPQKHLTRGTD